ncbi:3-hydroxyacyl-CoA dehydrogenase, NAD binding domain [Salipiger abyssi]|uniref:3-hydroxyacyl-CoA dehydrogenase, NAD binding domain n=1 Tax=Salipiger abyssi TaxID=1250539 RepID=A0A1P8US66_9RHOB|nr:3-hydroxyacyl-CoA dehydrogenase, NAD binding domain [Salipiger abyssi]
MGRGIAQVFAQSGYDVMLQDVSSDALGIAEGFIKDRLDRNVTSGKMTAGERAATLERLSYGSSIEPLGARDLIVESATEKEAVKVGSSKPSCRICPIIRF